VDGIGFPSKWEKLFTLPIPNTAFRQMMSVAVLNLLKPKGLSFFVAAGFLAEVQSFGTTCALCSDVLAEPPNLFFCSFGNQEWD
jgi:hypothetical protein